MSLRHPLRSDAREMLEDQLLPPPPSPPPLTAHWRHDASYVALWEM